VEVEAPALGSGSQSGSKAAIERSEQREPHENPFFDSLNKGLLAPRYARNLELETTP